MRSDRGHAPFWGDEREASSYDEVSRAEYRRRAQRFGGDGSGGFDGGINVVLIVFACAFALIIAKLIMLQVVDAPELARSAELTRTNALTLRAKRGTIYDRNGNVLAISVDCKTIYCNPQEVTEPESTADILMEYLEGKREDFLAILESEGTFAKKSAASATVISRTSAMDLPPYVTSRVSELKRLPPHCSHVT